MLGPAADKSTMTWLIVTEYMCYKWQWTCLFYRKHNSVLSSFVTYHHMLDKSNTTAAISEAGTAYPVGSFEFTIVFYGFRAAQSLVFCRSLFIRPFSFRHCIACPVYDFWLSLWHRQAFLIKTNCKFKLTLM